MRAMERTRPKPVLGGQKVIAEHDDRNGIPGTRGDTAGPFPASPSNGRRDDESEAVDRTNDLGEVTHSAETNPSIRHLLSSVR